MTQGWRRSVPSWRVHESRSLRYDWVLGALLVVAVLLTEVWQSSTVAGLSVQISHANDARNKVSAALGWSRAELDKSTSRSQLGPMAADLDLRPGDPGRIVSLPEAYLEPADSRLAADAAGGLFAFAGKAMASLVPDAQARGRLVK